VWGGLLTVGAIHRGVQGVVLSGRCRDIIQNRGFNFPIFARGHSTRGQKLLSRPSELNIPLTIHPIPEPETGGERVEIFPSTTVHPGDIIVGDVEGVVCIPLGMVDAVLKQCKVGTEVEEKRMEDLRAGKGVHATLEKWQL